MSIVFEALSVINYGSAGASYVAFHQAGRGFDISAGDSVGVSRMVFGHLGAGDVFDYAELDPPIPATGGGVVYFGHSGAPYSREFSDGYGPTVAFGHRGADIATGSSAGRGAIVFDHVGIPRYSDAAYAFLVAPPSGLTAYSGYDYAALREDFGVASADSTLPVYVLRDAARFSETRQGSIESLIAVADAMGVSPSTAFVIFQSVSDAVALNAVATEDYTAVARAIDLVLAHGVASSYLEAALLVLDAIAVRTIAQALDFEQVVDAVLLNTLTTETYLALGRVLEALLTTTEASGAQHITVLVEDQFVSAGTELTAAEAYALVRESVGLSMHLSLDTGEYTAWVVNTEGRGVSTYTNYPFNSFAKLGGRYYGATSEGVFLLEGEDDDGAAINARIRLGLTDMNTRKLKRLPEAYIGYKSDGNLLLRVIVTDDRLGEKVALEYLMRPRPAVALRESRFEPGKGVKAVDWDFEFENINGADFDLAEVEFHPLIMDRRTRG